MDKDATVAGIYLDIIEHIGQLTAYTASTGLYPRGRRLDTSKGVNNPNPAYILRIGSSVTLRALPITSGLPVIRALTSAPPYNHTRGADYGSFSPHPVTRRTD